MGSDKHPSLISLRNNTDHNRLGSRVEFPGEIYPTSPQAGPLKPLEHRALTSSHQPDSDIYFFDLALQARADLIISHNEVDKFLVES